MGYFGILTQRYDHLGIFNRVECRENIYIAIYFKIEPN